MNRDGYPSLFGSGSKKSRNDDYGELVEPTMTFDLSTTDPTPMTSENCSMDVELAPFHDVVEPKKTDSSIIEQPKSSTDIDIGSTSNDIDGIRAQIEIHVTYLTQQNYYFNSNSGDMESGPLMFKTAAKTARSLKLHICALVKQQGPIIKNEDMGCCMKLLKLQLSDEGFDSVEVSSIYDDMAAAKNVDTFNSNLGKLIGAIDPLNIDAMIPMIEKASHASEQVRDKNVVLLLGPSRAGKSTTMHVLGGSKMTHQYVGGFDHFEPEFSDQQLADVIACSSTRSVTRFVKAIRLQNLTTGETVYVCDTPGFEDTDGPEIDIANGLGIVNALRVAKSIKIIILITETDIRNTINSAMKKLIKILSALFRDTDTVLPACSYLFTQCQNERIKLAIPDRFDSLIRELSSDDRANLKLMSWLHDIRMKVQNNVTLLFPDEPYAANHVWNLINQTTAIVDLSSVVHHFVSPHSFEVLNKQLLIMKSSFQNCIAKENWHAAFAKNHVLKSLLFLDCNELSEIRYAFEECRKDLERTKEEATKAFGNLLRWFVEKSECHQADELELSTAAQHLASLLEAFNRYEATLVEVTKFQLNTYFKAAEASLISPISKSDFSALLSRSNIARLRKLHFLVTIRASSNFFLNYESQHQTGASYFYNFLSSASSMVVDMIRRNQYPMVDELFNQIKNVDHEIFRYLDAQHFKDALNSCYITLDKHFVDLFDTVGSFLNEINSQRLEEDQLLRQALSETDQHMQFIERSNGAAEVEHDVSLLTDIIQRFHTNITKRVDEVTAFLLNEFSVLRKQKDRFLVDVRGLLSVNSKLRLFNFLKAPCRKIKFTLESYIRDLLHDVHNSLLGDLELEDWNPQIWIENMKLLKEATFIQSDLNEAANDDCSLPTTCVEDILSSMSTKLQGKLASVSAKLQVAGQSVVDDENIFDVYLKVKRNLDAIKPSIDCVTPSISKEYKDTLPALRGFVVKSIDNLFTTIFNSLCSSEKMRSGSLTTGKKEECLKCFQKIDDLYNRTSKDVSVKWIVDHMSRKMADITTAYSSELESIGKSEVTYFCIQILQFTDTGSEVDLDALFLSFENIMSYLCVWEEVPNAEWNKLCACGKSAFALLMSETVVSLHTTFQATVNIIKTLTGKALCIDILRKIDRYILVAKKFESCIGETCKLWNMNFPSLIDEATIWSKQQQHSMASRIEVSVKDINFKGLEELLFELSQAKLTELVAEALDSLKRTINLRHEELRVLCNEPSIRVPNKNMFISLKSKIMCVEAGNRILNSTGNSLIPLRIIDLNNYFSRILEHLSQTAMHQQTSRLFGDAASTVELLRRVASELWMFESSSWNHAVVATSFSDTARKLEEELLTTIRSDIDKLNKLDYAAFAAVIPKQLWEQLKNSESPELKCLANHLFEIIEKTIKDAIENVSKSFKIEVWKTTIREMESLKPFLPLKLMESMQAQIKKFNTKIKQMEAEINRNALELQDISKWNDLHKRYISALKQNEVIVASELRKSIDIVINQEVMKFTDDMKRGDIETCCNEIPKAWTAFSEYVSTLHSSFGVQLQMTMALSCLYRDNNTGRLCLSLLMNFCKFVNDYIECTTITATSNNVSSTLFGRLEHSLFIICRIRSWESSSPKFYREFINSCSNLKNALHSCMHAMESSLKPFYEYIERCLSILDFENLLKLFNVISESKNQVQNILRYLDEPKCFPEFNAQYKALKEIIVSYEDLTATLATKVLHTWNLLDNKFYFNEKTSTPNSSDRKLFYQEYFNVYNQLRSVVLVSKHLNPNAYDHNSKKAVYDEQIKTELNKFHDHLMRLINGFPATNKVFYSEFNFLHDNLVCFSETFRDNIFNTTATEYLRKVDFVMHERFKVERESLKRAIQNNSTQEIMNHLICLKEFTVELFPYQEIFSRNIDSVLQDMVRSDATIIAKLGTYINNSDNTIAKMLLDHNAFEDYQIYLRNAKTLTFTVDDVLGISDPQSKNVLKGEFIDTNALKMLHVAFDKAYWEYVGNGFAWDDQINQTTYLNNLIKDALKFTTHSGSNTRDSSGKYIVLPEETVYVMACVFAYWTLKRLYSKPRAHASNSNDVKVELLQPHAAQIIAMFRLLGLDSNITVHHLAQIKTGEGKSVVLAVTSVILALYGYRVDCACYSEYLSHRDYAAFSELFVAFKVKDKIRYGTFHNICELFLNKEVTIRAEIENLIRYNQFCGDLKSLKREEVVLLIDEVDVFLSKDFYGNLYRPITQLRHSCIVALIEYLWRERKQLMFKRDMIDNPLYENCLKAFPSWRPLLEECLKSLFYDLQTFESHQYEVIDGQIGYRDQDGISFSLQYGYKTMFAHYQEAERGNIHKSALENASCLQITCGVFAYAEIPKMYKCILGVTGTLDTLIDKEWDILKNIYDLHKYSYIPSMYGENQLDFRKDNIDDLIIETERSAYLTAICNQIICRSENGKRAVLAFFQSKESLYEFYNSQVTQGLRKGMYVLTEETTSAKKEDIIIRAVTPGAITLMTKAFGRGTDFICHDDIIQKHGGVHVLQTFLSDLVSEETQIMGRTARQGNKGTFGMVLHAADLEKYGIDSCVIDEIRNTGKRYSVIANKRNEAFNNLYNDNMKFVEDIKCDHDIASEFLGKLVTMHNNMDDLCNTLVSFNQRITMDLSELDVNIQRTLCLMDATGSMSSFLEKAKNTVHKMFERTKDILNQNRIKDIFMLQFAVYRNYGIGPGRLFMVSPWATEPSDIRTFMQTVASAGGEGNEAIEIALNYAAQLHASEKLTQVLLIGDMPPNTREEVTTKRKAHDWSSTPYHIPTFYEDEVQNLKLANVPVHTFYLTNKAKSAFDHIAMETSGTSAPLNIDSAEGAERLTEVVATKLLTAGKSVELCQKLLSDYKEKYGGHCGYVN